jgi:hypothetical protein
MFRTHQEDDMTTETELERLYERVELVHERGERRRARLCIMSLVALLAGERHTDAPATASPLIRQLAITLNDAMPYNTRQRLKPFAPRIIGTNDGQDQQRLIVVREFLLREIVPDLDAELAGGHWAPPPLDTDSCTYAAPDANLPQEFILGFVSRTYQGGNTRTLSAMALIAAKLLVMCAISVTPSARAERYWAKSIDLLDRLCDVKAAEGLRSVPPVQILRAQHALEHAARFGLLARASEALRACLPSGDNFSSLKSCLFASPGPSGETPAAPKPHRTESQPLMADEELRQ